MEQKDNSLEINEGLENNFLPPDKPSTAGEVSIDSEILIHKAFEKNFDTGIEFLFRWYYEPMCSHAIRYVSSKEIAEDIVSDVFCTLYLEKSVSHIKTSFRAYLFTWVRNRAFNYVRL